MNPSFQQQGELPAREDRVVSSMAHNLLPLWFPVFRQLAREIPPEWLSRLSSATVERAMWGRASVREAIEENLSRVLGLPSSSIAVEEAGLAMLANHSRLWIDFLRYSDRGDIDPDTLISRHEGTHLLHEARDAGRGGILLTAHVGNFELGGFLLRKLGFRVAAVYRPDPSPVVERHRIEARQAVGVEGIPVTSSSLSFLSVLRALEGNTLVAMQGDRDVSGTGRRLPFFGETASFPVGPFRLAAVSGSPLLPVFVLVDPSGRYQTIVKPPISVEGCGRDARDEAITAAMNGFVALLEETIRSHPSQWYQFTPFWE
jgi:KDO2-lipid IV(A) lauroyltransferase